MGKLKKALKKFDNAEKIIIKNIITQLKTGLFDGLDIKKLQDSRDIYRVKKKTLRILFYFNQDKEIIIFTIERRSDNTYKF